MEWPNPTCEDRQVESLDQLRVSLRFTPTLLDILLQNHLTQNFIVVLVQQIVVGSIVDVFPL
jgi:hypothetical protein